MGTIFQFYWKERKVTFLFSRNVFESERIDSMKLSKVAGWNVDLLERNRIAGILSLAGGSAIGSTVVGDSSKTLPSLSCAVSHDYLLILLFDYSIFNLID